MHAILLFFAFENKPNATGSILTGFDGPTLPMVLPGTTENALPAGEN
jgi:hypothetical protein